MRNFETESNDLTKGLTETLGQKMTANACSVLRWGCLELCYAICGEVVLRLGFFYGFFWGWGRAVVLLWMTQPPQSWMGLIKAVSSTAIPFSAPARSRCSVLWWGCAWGPRAGSPHGSPLPPCLPPRRSGAARPSPCRWQSSGAPPRPRCCFLPDI